MKEDLDAFRGLVNLGILVAVILTYPEEFKAACERMGISRLEAIDVLKGLRDELGYKGE